jgi:hypothetical protein
MFAYRSILRGGQDSNLRYACAYNCLAGSPNRPLWHLPRYRLLKAEGVGFEPTVAETATLVFKTNALNRSAIPPSMTDPTVPAILAQYL